MHLSCVSYEVTLVRWGVGLELNWIIQDYLDRTSVSK